MSNAEVKAALTDFQSGVEGFAGLFDGVEDGDMTALAAKVTDLEKITTQISESATKLGELCPVS